MEQNKQPLRNVTDNAVFACVYGQTLLPAWRKLAVFLFETDIVVFLDENTLTHLVIMWLLSIRTEAEISERVDCRLSNVFYFGQAARVVVATIRGGLTTPSGEVA